MRLGDLDALKDDFESVGFNDYDDYKRALRIIDNAPPITSQALINGIVEIISKNGLTSIDELLETLKKGVNND